MLFRNHHQYLCNSCTYHSSLIDRRQARFWQYVLHMHVLIQSKTFPNSLQTAFIFLGSEINLKLLIWLKLCSQFRTQLKAANTNKTSITLVIKSFYMRWEHFEQSCSVTVNLISKIILQRLFDRVLGFHQW